MHTSFAIQEAHYTLQNSKEFMLSIIYVKKESVEDTV
jgi:hypothetical protein